MSRFNESWKNKNRVNSRNFDNYLDSIVSEGGMEESTEPPVSLGNKVDIEMEENTDPLQSVDTDPQIQSNQVLPQKLDVMMLTNGWNDKNERIVISIGENAASYKWMHEKSSAQYRVYNKIFGIAMIILSTALTAESILPNENLALFVVRRVFTYILTILTVIANFLKLAKMSEEHLSSAVAFSKLYHDIQQQMCMYRRDRRNATKYVADVLKQYDTLVVNGPTISSRIVTDFKNTFKSSDIALPDIADRIQKIEIVTETTSANVGAFSNQNSSKNVDLKDIQGKRYGRYGMNNLEQIHKCFQISGDITDNDIQNATPVQLRDMREKYLVGKSDYEYQRFKLHANDND